MKAFALLVWALVVVASLHPDAAQGASSGCPRLPPKFVGTQPTLPDEAKTTSATLVFEVDVGSDGRARGVQLVHSSGDAAVDLAFRQDLSAGPYTPSQTGCVASSGALIQAYTLPPAPAQSSSPPATPSSAAPAATCTPYVTAFLDPAPHDRKRTGTAVVAVALDAAGTRTAEPVLHTRSGSPVLDAEALGIARAAQYGYLQGTNCAPQPFTYLLELTFS